MRESNSDIIKKLCHSFDYYDYLHVVTRSLKSNEHQFYYRVLFERDIYSAVIINSQLILGDGEYTRKVVNLIDRFSAVLIIRILSPKRARECFYSLAVWNPRTKIKPATSILERQLEYVCEFHPVYNNDYLASSTTVATVWSRVT